MSPRAKATALVTAAFYACLVSSVLSEPDFWNGAFGPTAFGLPTPLFVAAVVTLFYLPVPWLAWHATGIVLRGRDFGMSLGKVGIIYTMLTIGRRDPEFRRSQRIVLGGFLYFVALVAAWIWYAGSRGI